jgi:hypothetical protein
MAVKLIEVYQGIKTVHTCRLYGDDFRTLFKLPRTKGKILSVELMGQTVFVSFEIERHKYIGHKLTTRKER